VTDRRFGTAAGRLAGLAGRMLGWRPPEFWAATPAELAAILHAGSEGEAAPVDRTELQRMMENEP